MSVKPYPLPRNFSLVPLETVHRPLDRITPKTKPSAQTSLESIPTPLTTSSTMTAGSPLIHRSLANEIGRPQLRRIRRTFVGIGRFVCSYYVVSFLTIVLQRRAASVKPEVQQTEASMITTMVFLPLSLALALTSLLQLKIYVLPSAHSVLAETKTPETQIGPQTFCILAPRRASSGFWLALYRTPVLPVFSLH